MDKIKEFKHNFMIVHCAAYRAGAASKLNQNPYEFPRDTENLRLLISTKVGPLNEDAKFTLRMLNNLMEQSDWSMFSNGHFTELEFKNKSK